MKTIKLSIVILASYLATGCATTSDIENIQSEINLLKLQVAGASSSATASTEAATEARSKAANAEAAANRAAHYAQETNSKLDKALPTRTHHTHSKTKKHAHH